jgi:F-type H+-transporting ATPase subunit b
MTLDPTLVVFELVNFGVLVLLLNRFVFGPVARTLEQRRSEIAAREAEMAGREAAASELRSRYETALEQIDRQAEARLAAALDEARAEAERLITRARDEARTLADQSRDELDSGRRRALGHFRVEIMQLASEAAGRVIRELGAPEVGLAFVRRALHALEQVRERSSIATLTFQVSPELDPREVELEVRRALPNARVHVEPDPHLIGGVRVLADGHEIEASAGASLAAWSRRLIAADELAS